MRPQQRHHNLPNILAVPGQDFVGHLPFRQKVIRHGANFPTVFASVRQKPQDRSREADHDQINGEQEHSDVFGEGEVQRAFGSRKKLALNAQEKCVVGAQGLFSRRWEELRQTIPRPRSG
jgi:hypothetical protein